MIKADAPHGKLYNPHLKEFLEKNIGESMPDYSIKKKKIFFNYLRKNITNIHKQNV